MKIRGESGSMPARMGGAVSGASRGGAVKAAKPARKKIVAKKAVLTKEQQIAREAKIKEKAKLKAISTPGVKVVAKGPNARPEDAFFRRAMETYRIGKIKSGEFAKISAPAAKPSVGTIKISSTPKKSADAAKAAANAKALKAINKKK